MSSIPSYIKCHQCKRGPKQFTFLLCNHIICGQCISKNIQNSSKYNLVRCSCGSITYFNQQNQIMDNQRDKFSTEQINQKQQKRKQKKQNQRFSFDQKSCFQSRQTINPCSKTLINQRSTMPMLEVSDVFSLNKSQYQDNQQYRPKSPTKQRYLNGNSTSFIRCKPGTQKTMYQQSLLLQNYQNGQTKRLESMQAINEFSTHEIKSSTYSDYQQKIIRNSAQSKNTSSNNVNKKIIQNGQIKSSNIEISPFKRQQIQINNGKQIKGKSKDKFHSQFQSEIEFLSILFKKDIEQIQFYIKKVLEDFNNSYKELQDELRSLYVEQVITKQSLFSFNLSSLIKSKYQNTIGIKFKKLKDQLLSSNKKQSLIKDLNQRNQPFIEQLQTFNNGNVHSFQKISPKFYDSLLKQQNGKYLHNYPTKTVTKNGKKYNELNQNESRVSNFQTVQQRMDKFRSKQKYRNNQVDQMYRDIYSKNNRLQNDSFQEFDSGKRIQTQNIHTQIKRSKRGYAYQNERPTRYESNDIQSQQFGIRSQKPMNKTFVGKRRHENEQDQNENIRKHIIYFSPPYSYCQKHYNKRSKQAKNYISYIQKLCHEKKMKNNKELFKKAKISHPYEFKLRE